ncbi:MAG: GreA/GreB family elongation factor [Dehalococcoidia bacterium]
MAEIDTHLTLGEAATRYLSSLSPQERQSGQQEVHSFVRWYGWERPLAQLTPPEVANFAERVASSTRNPGPKLEPVRAFLLYAKSHKLTATNMAAHLKLKKAAGRAAPASRRGAPPPSLTREGAEEMKRELKALRQERSVVVGQVRSAREDKDFRENAPLEAARERLAQMDSRIKTMEAALGGEVVEKQAAPTRRAGLGSKVTISDPTGTSATYTLVDPSEASLAKGKISVTSPLGRALLNRGEGQEVEVQAPVGRLRYRLETIAP